MVVKMCCHQSRKLRTLRCHAYLLLPGCLRCRHALAARPQAVLELAGPSQAALWGGNVGLPARALHPEGGVLQTSEALPAPARIHV